MKCNQIRLHFVFSMMMNSISILRFTGFLMLTILLFSCDKEPEELKPESAPCLSYLTSMDMANNILLTFQYYYPEDLANPGQQEGISIHVSPLYPVDSFPKIITIAFDSSGVNCPDNAVRKGTLTCRLNAPWHQNPSKADITFTDFSIDNKQISGLFIFSTALSGDSLFYNYQIENGTISDERSGSVTFELNCTILAGTLQRARSLDPFSWQSTANHSFSGTDFNQKAYTVTIARPLFFSNTCENGEITIGEILIEPDGTAEYSADFGQGSCDRNLTLLFNGNRFPVSF